MTEPGPPPAPAPLSERSWGDLYDFLDPGRQGKQGPDRDREAEAKCAEIVRKLVFYFTGRACGDAEDLAMETILRVAAKCREVDVSRHDDRVGYFYGVGRNVLHEWRRGSLRESAKLDSFRREITRLLVPEPWSWRRQEAVQRCLDLCMAKLTRRARRLILSYYVEEKAAKIESRRRLADELGESVNALRIEVHRIRSTLRECVFGCLRPEGPRPEPAAAGR
jgi:RNA polymerase sigma factor (sigma-70 family)